ncbi:hypothetical protein [Acetobacter nitrogenifigens]|uniref:hypothetical protein n=1 Tax=Acetobacter nitrogenifigens TaxID=285268 RepID=UPI001B7F865D|nr:hypothetical protein [Acetobacter nitrogenifigens]
MTELAKAIILEPRIATRMTLVWIGGNEYPSEHFEQPTASKPEYNMTIDLDSCRYIFNNCNIPIWQVPRNTYRRMLISYSELCNIGRTCGTLGKFLLQSINDVADLAVRTGKLKNGIGETYILGDSPLVTLTALQSSFDPDTSSSNFAIKRAPKIDSCGNYTHNEEGRAIRIYSEIDSRLTFEDMKTKFFSHAKYL